MYVQYIHRDTPFLNLSCPVMFGIIKRKKLTPYILPRAILFFFLFFFFSSSMYIHSMSERNSTVQYMIS